MNHLVSNENDQCDNVDPAANRRLWAISAVYVAVENRRERLLQRVSNIDDQASASPITISLI